MRVRNVGAARNIARLMAACSAIALMPAAASAQTAPGDNPSLEQIIVTATRRAENVQDVPYNISALGAADVRRLGLTDISDLARVTPGLTLIDAGPRNIGSTIIRGLSTDPLRTPDTGDNGSVATYINDTPLLTQPKLIDVNRVEVLRGPQGTLYGSGSLGGSIRYIINDPNLQETEGSAKLKLYQIKEADDLSYEAEAVVNVPIVADKLAARLAVNYVDDSGYVDYPLVIAGAEEDVDWEERLTARGSIAFTPAEWLELVGSFYFDSQDTGGRTGVNPGFRPDPVGDLPNGQRQITLGKYELASRYLEPSDLRDRIWSLEATADLGFAELVSSSSLIRSQFNGQRDQTDLLVGFEYGYEDYPGFSAFTREDEGFEAFVQEVRLVSASEGPLQYVAGVYFTDEDTYNTSQEFVPGFPQFIGVNRPDNLEYFSIDDSADKEKAVFGEVTYNLTDAWSVTGGLRYFELDQTTESCLAFPLFPYVSPTDIDLDCEAGKSEITDTIYKFNTSYRFTDDVMSYFTFSQGFRRGGANNVPAGGQVVILPEERFFSPDTVDNYELGMRSTWFENRMRLNAALFYIDWNDIQVAARTAEGSIPITANAGAARSMGLELDSQFALTDAVTLTFGYAYVNAELTEDYQSSGDSYLDGTRLPGSPRHALNTGVDVEQPLGGWGTLFWHADANYTSNITTYADRTNPDYTTLPGYWLVNASVTLEREDGWSGRLFVRNLFDEYNYIGQRGPEAYGEQGRFYLIPRPRVLGVEITKRF